jgi:hypothetical protein
MTTEADRITLYVFRGGRYVPEAPRRGERAFTRVQRGKRWRYVPLPQLWWAHPLPAALEAAKLAGWLVLDRGERVPGWELRGWWVGWDTESNVLSVIYRPLYKNTYLKADYCVRPYKMFIEDVEVEGKRIKRFKKITNAKIITKLKKIRKEMYLMK